MTANEKEILDTPLCDLTYAEQLIRVQRHQWILSRPEIMQTEELCTLAVINNPYSIQLINNPTAEQCIIALRQKGVLRNRMPMDKLSAADRLRVETYFTYMDLTSAPNMH